MPGTRKLGRTTAHRTAMLRAMVTYLLENGQIETTVTRAKEVRSVAEKMITLGKNTDLHSKRQVYSYITKWMSLRRSLTRSLRSLQTATAVIRRSSRSARAVVMPLRWRSSSWLASRRKLLRRTDPVD